MQELDAEINESARALWGGRVVVREYYADVRWYEDMLCRMQDCAARALCGGNMACKSIILR